MARKTVVAIECGRCKRVEYLEAPPEDGAPAVLIQMRGGLTVKWEDLCENCTKIVVEALNGLTKPMEKKSPIRKKKDEEKPAGEAPTEPPPVPRVNNGQHVRGPRG